MDSSEIMDESDIFASPTKTPKTKHNARGSEAKRPKTPSPANKATPFDAEEVREAALRRELEGVRNINQVIEGVIGTLEKAKGNMGTVSQTVTNASTLLNTWTRILSQTEHNQRVILDPNWNGATQDLADLENEALQKQLAAERRAVEEERRREEAKRRMEEEAERRAAAAAVTPAPRGGTRGTRGRGRAVVRSSGYGTSSYRPTQRPTTPGDTTGSSIGSGRGTSGIGRGFGISRGRARGSRP